MPTALSPGLEGRCLSPSRPILKRISSALLILRTISQVLPALSSLTNSRTSFSLHSTHLGCFFKMRSQAFGVSESGKNKKDHDSVAVVSSNFRKGAVQ